MSWFSKFIGTDRGLDTVDKTIDNISKGIDALWFTEEEKSQASMKVVEAQLKFMELNKDENSARSKVRRWMAVPIVFNYIVLIDYGIYSFVRGNVEVAAHIKEVLTSTYGSITLGVTFFYFGYYGIKSIVKQATGK